MKTRRLGRSDLHVSELCLGTASFGWRIDEEVSHALLDVFREAGGNFIQTCGATPDGTAVAERYLGRWMQARGIPRGDIIVAARCDVIGDLENGDVFRTASTIRRRCEQTLRELGMRYLDLLVLEWSGGLAMDEVLLAAETLVRAGLVRHFAVSGFPAWRVMEWLGHSARRNVCRIEAMQIELSLVANAALSLESLALARAHRVGLVARAPLAGGLLAGRDAPGPGSAGLVQETQSVLRRIAETRGVAPGQAAVAWVLAHADVSSVLIAPPVVARLQDHIAATALGLSFSELRRLDGLWKSSVGPSFGDDDDPAVNAAALRLEVLEPESSENLNV